MQVTAYKYFLTSSRVGSVRKAADILHVSPSAISKQIANLEYTFKAKLINRLPSGIELTEEGKILARHMEKTVREMEIAKSKIDEINGILSGTIKYATIEGVAKEWVFPCIKSFIESYPKTNFNGKILGSDSVYEKIRSGSIDFGIVMDTKIPVDIEAIQYFETYLVVVVNKDHYLANKDKVSLTEVVPYDLVMLNQKFLTRQLIEQSINDMSIDLKINFELDSIEMIKHYIRGSESATILPHFCMPKKPKDDGLRYITIEKFEVKKCFTIACKKPGRHLIKAASRFISKLLDESKNINYLESSC